MSIYTHMMIPTQFIEANGVVYAHCQFGQQESIPLALEIL